MKYLCAVFLAFSCSLVNADGLWGDLVEGKLRNNASTSCVNDGISPAGFFSKDKEVIDARYELCIQQYVNSQIQTKIEKNDSVRKEISAIQSQIDELIKQRERMLRQSQDLL